MGGHAAARRGRKALMVKALSHIERADEKKELEIDSPELIVKLENIQKVVPFLSLVHTFPVTVRLALSVPISGQSPQTAYKYLCGTVFGVLTRTRPEWARHVPSFYHAQKALKAAEGVGPVIQQITALVSQKMNKHVNDYSKFCSTLAEIILQLFLVSAVDDATDLSDCSIFAAPVCQLIWIAASMKSCFSKTASAVINEIDDQFTVRVSPYRGIKRSNPTTAVLDSVMQKSLHASIGIPSSMPSQEIDDGLIQTAALREFVREFAVSVTACEVSKSLSRNALQLIQSFNSRHQKAVNSRGGASPSFQSMLVRPWSDDVEIRAIVRVYARLAEILHDKTDMACLFGTVLAGAWASVDNLPFVSEMVHSAKEEDTLVNFGIPGEYELRPNWWRMLLKSFDSPSNAYIGTLNSKPEYMTHRAATRIQSFWRGAIQRHSKGVGTICEFMQNTGWPEFVIDDETIVSPSLGTSLTRASLMKLASMPKVKPQQERSPTPASTVSYGQRPTPVPSPSSLQTVQADHVACANLLFVLSYALYAYRTMSKYWAQIVYALEWASARFAELLDRAPDYQIAHDSWSVRLKRFAIKSERSPVKKLVSPVVVVEKTIDEPRKDKAQRSLLGHTRNTTTIVREVSSPVKLKVSSTNKTQTYKMTQQSLSEYIKFFDGDDSLLRDISPNCCDSMIVPPSTTDETNLIWLPIRASRFQSARAKLYAILKGESSKSIFNRAEEECEFIKCTSVLAETEQGSLNVLTGVPNNNNLWIENVYHLIIGYLAQASRLNKFKNALDLVHATLNGMRATLANANPSHRDAIEAMVFDAAIGVGYLAPMQAQEYIREWYLAAAERYQRLGHVFRLAKCSCRFACALAKQQKHVDARHHIAVALDSLIDKGPTPMLHILKINRSLLRSQAGEDEAAEVEIREVFKKSKEVRELQPLVDVAEKLKIAMTTKRHELRK